MSVLDALEDILEEVVTLALFVPLLIGTGGKPAPRRPPRSHARSPSARYAPGACGRRGPGDPRGVVLGATFGLLGYPPVAVLFDTGIATVVSVTLVAICTLATFAGSILPLLAKRLGVDSAVVSAPMITTIGDATGLVVYFLIARAVLRLA